MWKGIRENRPAGYMRQYAYGRRWKRFCGNTFEDHL